jgi:hypothetical protein
MMREHFTKEKDGEFMGVISRVTSSGRYKPNWVWQKVNRSSSTSEPRKVEEIEEGQEKQEEGQEKQEEGQGKQEEGQGKQEEGQGKEGQEKQEEGKPQKKKVIYVKRKTLKKSPSPPSPS